MYIIIIMLLLAGCSQPAPTPAQKQESDVPRWRVQYRVIRHADDPAEDDLPDPCGLESVVCPHE